MERKYFIERQMSEVASKGALQEERKFRKKHIIQIPVLNNKGSKADQLYW